MDFNTLVKHFIEQYGLISLFLIVMFEYANFPLPSEIVLPFLGIMIAEGNINFVLALIISILGGIVGSITNYFLGFYFGKPLLKYLIKKYPKFKKSVNSSMSYIDKYGKLSVMVARVVPLARTVISIPAGIIKMNLLSFTVYSSIGIGIWNTVLIYLGYVLGDNLHMIGYLIKNYSLMLVLLLVIGIIWYFIKRKTKNNSISEDICDDYRKDL